MNIAYRIERELEYMSKFNLVATSAMGVEALVADEVKALGYETRTENGKVYFQGDETAIARTNMWLLSLIHI